MRFSLPPDAPAAVPPRFSLPLPRANPSSRRSSLFSPNSTFFAVCLAASLLFFLAIFLIYDVPKPFRSRPRLRRSPAFRRAVTYERIQFQDIDGGPWKQGWRVGYNGNEWDGEKLKIFVVSHSHNDPGWKKTVEEYYQYQSKHILDTIVETLSKDPRRKFIWEEMSYLERWWRDASGEKKEGFTNLVRNGQLEIVGGGWVMNDEVTGDNVYTSASTFEDLNLSKELIQGLYVEMRFKSPSKIQAVTLPMILTPPYKDLVAQAHNGSGKTTCFVLGMLSRVDPSKKIPQAICICPTRELAQQNLEVLKKMGKFTGITAVCAIPSDSAHYTPVKRMPPVTDQVVIGTPGTVKRWMSEKKLAMREVKILVFDEADHMLAEDGFKDDSDRIMREIRRSSNRCQVLLFSATFNETVKAFVSKVITDGNQIFVKKEDLSLDKVKQYKVFCPDELAKLEVIKTKIFEFGEKVGQTIIFVRTRNSASMLHKTLKNEGYECTSIQGTLRQEDREQVIREFKDGYTKVLITTDILARGFDQAQVNLVINFDLPVKHNTSEPDYETYLHRIGRAGRFGRKGAAFNLMSSDWDRKIVEKIENNFKHPIPEVGDWRSEKDFESALKDAGLL